MVFRKLFYVLAAGAAALMASSCSTYKSVPYFQDASQIDTSLFAVPQSQVITLRPGDKVSILVNCADPQIANLFNLPYMGRMLGQVLPTQGSSQGMSAYTIDSDGKFDFPVLGRIQAAGLTRMDLAESIKRQLRESGQADDAVVVVEYQNLTVDVIGEVARPGRFTIDKDVFTIMDALSMAGDLTIYGLRQNVTVKRIEDGVAKFYVLDMTSAESVLSSPAYYMQQGDVVYVYPNNYRVRMSTVNGNTVLSASFWISIANLLTTVAVLLF